MRLSDTENTIINAMARAFYVSAWGQKQEERGRTFPGQELMDVAPKTPKFVRDFALMFAGRLHEANGKSLLILLMDAAKADGLVFGDYGTKLYSLNPKTFVLLASEYADKFGHYVAMQALGTGVSWSDDHAKFDLKVPHVEFYL